MATALGSGSLLRPQTPARDEPPIRIAVASGIRLYREGLAASLGGLVAFEVVATAVDAERSLDALAAARPDVVLLDASGERSVRAVRALASALPSARVLALAVVEAEADVIPLAEAGVAGYLTVDQSLAELAETIVAVARGENPCSPGLAAMLLRRVTVLACVRAHDGGAALTTREREILALLERGLSNKEIARDLQIGVATVKNHVHNILGKLDVPTRGAAAARARI
jgi:two-component system, NarL family, nitrate/nitrite response regulator NarL